MAVSACRLWTLAVQGPGSLWGCGRPECVSLPVAVALSGWQEAGGRVLVIRGEWVQSRSTRPQLLLCGLFPDLSLGLSPLPTEHAASAWVAPAPAPSQSRATHLSLVRGPTGMALFSQPRGHRRLRWALGGRWATMSAPRDSLGSGPRCRFQRNVLDLTLPWRFANLPNNAKLEMVPASRSREGPRNTVGARHEARSAGPPGVGPWGLTEQPRSSNFHMEGTDSTGFLGVRRLFYPEQPPILFWGLMQMCT